MLILRVIMHAYRAHGGQFVLASPLRVATGDRKKFQATNSSNSQSTISGNQVELIENRTFEEINVGDAAVLERTLTEQDITLFAVMSGDINPAHVDPEYAMSSRFREVIGHGMWSGALISTVLGTDFPGPGTIYLGQSLRFRRPVKVGDTITIKVTAKEKDATKGKVVLDTECVNQDGEIVVSGSAEVIAPKEKVRRPKVYLPAVHFDDKETRSVTLWAGSRRATLHRSQQRSSIRSMPIPWRVPQKRRDKAS